MIKKKRKKSLDDFCMKLQTVNKIFNLSITQQWVTLRKITQEILTQYNNPQIGSK